MTLREKVKAYERELLVQALRSDQRPGRVSRIAKTLGIHRKTLLCKAKEHQIRKEEWHPQLPLQLAAPEVIAA